MKKIGVFLLLALMLPLALALNIPATPQVKTYVNDFAKVLANEQASQLGGMFANIDTETSAEVVFVSLDSCEGVPSDYATSILNTWKVGKADKNNGLVELYCKQENKFWVATGYGLEGVLPDSKIGRILDETYVPLRDSGNLSEGIVAASAEFSNVISQNREEVLSGQAGAQPLGWWVLVIPVIIFIIFVAFVVFIVIMIAKSKKFKMKPYEKRNESKRLVGIKKDTGFGAVNFIISVALLIGGTFFFNPVVGVIAFLLFRPLLVSLRGVRCAKDGLKMKKTGKEGNYETYKCPKGHIGKILVGAGAGFLSGYALGSASHGGFGGGGFGGGGFGGGGGGGGGAGR